jgi:threonine/homoserine/homoserine lactone efflux protein
MLLDIFKGYIIGLCAAAPIGPIAIFVLQKSIGEGRRSGFLTGLGSTVIDTFYATLAIFALAVAEEFFEAHRVLIYIVGGVIVAAFGANSVFHDPFRKLKPDDGDKYSPKSFFQAMLMALSNPGAIFVMFALFAFFGVSVSGNSFSAAPVIGAVACGSATYWFFFSMVFSHLRKSVQFGKLLWVNRIAGVALMIVGMALLADGLFKIIFA